MSELTALQERLAGLIASLSPAARRQMAADIAKKTARQSAAAHQATAGTRRHPVCRPKAPAGAK